MRSERFFRSSSVVRTSWFFLKRLLPRRTMSEPIRATRGYFEGFGGAYIPEILQATFDELNHAFVEARNDPAFWREYEALMGSYSCRPTPLTYAENLTKHF